jgi:hypothetical protein
MKKLLLLLMIIITLMTGFYFYAKTPDLSLVGAHKFFKSEIIKLGSKELTDNLKTSYCERTLDEVNDKALFYLCYVETTCEENMTMLIHNGGGTFPFLAWSGDSPERLLAYTCPEMIPDFDLDSLYRGG